jgi:hypothetical protein
MAMKVIGASDELCGRRRLLSQSAIDAAKEEMPAAQLALPSEAINRHGDLIVNVAPADQVDAELSWPSPGQHR